MALVYWITDNLFESPVNYGYVGITKNTLIKRLNSHYSKYKQFVNNKQNNSILYSKVRHLGGWHNVVAMTICEGDLSYCIDLEYRLRPRPCIAWNIRVGGDYAVMKDRVISEQTKLKLAKVRQTWVMSQDTRDKMSIKKKRRR
jgi:hypothetical protein